MNPFCAPLNPCCKILFIQLPNTYLSSSLLISCESLSVMNLRAIPHLSKVSPAEIIPFFIIGSALSIQMGSVITNNARMSNMKIKKIFLYEKLNSTEDISKLWKPWIPLLNSKPTSNF